MMVYLAAPFGARDLVHQYAMELIDDEFIIPAVWLLSSHEIHPGTEGAALDMSDEYANQSAYNDLHGVKDSDLFVLFTADSVGTEGGGGRHIETGYAIAMLGVHNIIVVGTPENIFHRMVGVTVVPDWEAAVIELKSRKDME